MTKAINRVTVLLVFGIAAIAFTLSYSALLRVAIDYGVPIDLAWLWPLLVDASLVVFSMAVVRASLTGEATWWKWVLVGLYTCATIAFNLIHAPANDIAQVVAVVAPVSLFLSFETLMAMLRTSAHRGVLAETVKGLAGQVDSLRGELTNLDTERQAVAVEITNKRKELGGEVKVARSKIDGLRQEYESLLAEMQRLQDRPSQKEANLDTLLTYLVTNPQATLTAAAGELGVSRQTVGNYAKELTEAGRMHRNGKGWELVKLE